MAINPNNWYWAMSKPCLVRLLSNNSALFGTLKLVVVVCWRLAYLLLHVDKIRVFPSLIFLSPTLRVDVGGNFIH